MAFHLASKFLAEFLGAFMLMLAVGLNESGSTMLSTTAIAFTLMVMIYALGDVSGAHFNPAVSLAATLSKKLPKMHLLVYVVAQLLGALAATGVFALMVRDVEEPASIVGRRYSLVFPYIAEAMYTCLLCFVVLSVACTKKLQPNSHYGLSIGLAIIAGGYPSAAVSQGILNPAVCLGLSLHQSKSVAPVTGVVAVLGEFTGAILAAALYRIIHPQEFDEDAVIGNVHKLIAEFVGTFYLVFSVVMNVLSGNAFVPWSVAATLSCVVYCFGEVSGSHVNPAVSVAIMLRGGIPKKDGAMYMLAQFFGGILGALLAVPLYPHQPASLAVGADYYLGQALAAEFIFTFLLAFVVINIATVKGKTIGDAGGLAVGSCITAGGFAAGRLSGGSFNPAVTVGLTFAGILTTPADSLFRNMVLYILIEGLGGCTAALVCMAVRLESAQEAQEVDDEAHESDDEEKQALLKEKPSDETTAASAEEAPETKEAAEEAPEAKKDS